MRARTGRRRGDGLYLCADCPTPDDASILLYRDWITANEPLPEGDYLLIHGVFDYDGLGSWEELSGQINGEMFVEWSGGELSRLVLPSMAATMPPQIVDAPERLSGAITIKRDGWQLAGSFDATPCTGLNWIPICE